MFLAETNEVPWLARLLGFLIVGGILAAVAVVWYLLTQFAVKIFKVEESEAAAAEISEEVQSPKKHSKVVSLFLWFFDAIGEPDDDATGFDKVSRRIYGAAIFFGICALAIYFLFDWFGF